MKTKLTLTLTFALTFAALTSNAQYAFQNISLLGRFDDPTVVAEPALGIRYQSCWGWTDPNNGREYGVIGSTAGTYIVEVTNATNPVVRDYVPGRSQARIWHEYKTYGKYLYMISDGGGNSLQIADLSYLPDSVHLVYDSTGIFDSGHTLYVDGNKLYVASVSSPGASFSSMNVYSLANPELPQLLARLDTDFPVIGSVHDMYVTNDTVYASCGYDGLYVFRFDTATNQFTQLSSLVVYPDQGYNHSSFLDRSHTVLYMLDEIPSGAAVKVVDVNDIYNPTVVDTFYSNPGATAHNPYVLNDELFIAYYQDGVQAYDISNPQAPVRNGYFDTHYQNPPGTYPGTPYQGCWATYTDLPSGHLLASDMQLGLFVLDISQVMSTGTPPENPNAPLLYPNPAQDKSTLTLPTSTTDHEISVYSATGQLLSTNRIDSRERTYTIALNDFPNGVYMVKVNNSAASFTRPIIVAR
ncbi:MAG: hypothetical protein RIQ47_954 [Bacteroidota bacterium]|jgi:choice-of-anchor B domain-containing protein